MSLSKVKLWLALAGVMVACSAGATTYTDNFNGGAATNQWLALGDACLTAGTQTGTSSLSNPIIPKCPATFTYGTSTYSIPSDETNAGKGALLLTPALNYQTGAILSAFPPFPMSQGIQITFTTYTFGGDSGGAAKNGADGIVFFLTDGTQAAPTTTGASGGSMGYDCSNGNPKYDGVAYGYLGLGIDEFGNFLNSGDNGTNPQVSPTGFNGGIYNTNDPSSPVYGVTPAPNGTNPYYNSNYGTITGGKGPQYQPERIGLRGAGNTNWAWLQSMNPSYYSGSSNASKVYAACSSGTYVASGTGSKRSPYVYQSIPYNYNAIPGGYAVLPANQPIANNSKSATRNPTSSTSPSNIAWPITYRLTISTGGLLNFAYSYNGGDFQPVITNTNITSFNGPVPASLRFGFSAGTGGDNNVHEITCFRASPAQSNSSAGSNTVTSKVFGNIQFFLGSYSTNNWWGSLVADPLALDANGNLIVGTQANWDAKCVLGGPSNASGPLPCDTMKNPTTGVAPVIPVQSPANRTLLTSNALGAGAGVPLQWSSLSTTEQSALNVRMSGTQNNPLDTTLGQNRVAWLRGDRSVEQLYTGCSSTWQATPPCDLRARTYVLGDIINSSPTFVSAPVAGFQPNTFYDQLYPTASNPEDLSGAQTYSAFVSSNAQRLNMVYVGSNDGFLHGFEAGNYNSDGTFNTATNDGKEMVGYMPYDVLLGKAANLTNPLYKHDYMVDATPAAGDVFYNGAWHTWLVGGVGSSGSEIYALNITNPSSMSAAQVIGDWDSSTLTHLGNTVGTPIIARMHNGDWAIIFASGLVNACVPPAGGTCPTPPTEGIYIGLIDPTSTTGAVTFKFLDTGALPTGINGAPGGIAYVSSVDLDGDHIADYLYAGDTQGNVWRFDVTSNITSNWKVSSFGGGGPSPLFVAKDASGNRQPITTSITALAVQTGTVMRAMLYFGTGQQIPATVAAGAQYAKGSSANNTAQTFYGIWDWNMSNWNSMSTTAKFASLSSASFTRNNLLAQALVTPPSDANYRYLSTTNVVCWEGDAATTQCPSPGQYGWFFDLPDPGPTQGSLLGDGEQIIYNPTFLQGAVVVNTAIPPKISAADCNPGSQTGWTMAFNPATGGGFPKGYFRDAGGGFSSGSSTVSGTQLNGVGTPTSFQYGGKNYIVTQTVNNAAVLIPTNPPANDSPQRVSWRELVNP